MGFKALTNADCGGCGGVGETETVTCVRCGGSGNAGDEALLTTIPRLCATLALAQQEPQIHSHLSDCLPDDHTRAFDQIHCDGCGCLVHAGNNECMTTWFEFRDTNVCAECVGKLPAVMYGNSWAPKSATPDGGPASERKDR